MKPAFTTKNKGDGAVVPLFFGVLASLLATALTAVLCAIVVSGVAMPAYFAPFSWISLAVGSFVFGLLLARQFRARRFLYTAIAALLLGSALMIVRLFLSPTPFGMESAIKLGAAMLPMVCAAFVMKERPKHKFSHRH